MGETNRPNGEVHGVLIDQLPAPAHLILLPLEDLAHEVAHVVPTLDVVPALGAEPLELVLVDLHPVLEPPVERGHAVATGPTAAARTGRALVEDVAVKAPLVFERVQDAPVLEIKVRD